MNINMSLIPEFEELYRGFLYSNNGAQLLEIEGIAPIQLDTGANSYNFFNKKLADIATDASVNFVEDISPSTYRIHTSNGQMKLLGYHLLWYKARERFGREFADKAMRMIWSGDLYFHDAHSTKIQIPYCYAFSLAPMVINGRPYGSSPNRPPKRRKSFLSQLDKLIADLSKQFAGAVAPSDFFLWYAYFCKKDDLAIGSLVNGRRSINPEHVDEVIQDFEGIVCLLNESARAEGDPPFTNIALYDMEALQKLFGHIIYPDGTKPDLDYIMQLQLIFAEWFSHGDSMTGFPYKFPVVTMNLILDANRDFMDEETAREFAKINCNMANFNLHFGRNSKVAMCCRYENDLDDMELTPDSFGNGGVNIGSHRIVTPNFGRAALLAHNNMDKFYEILDDYFDVSAKLLIVHRFDILQHRIDKNPDFLKFFGRLKWFDMGTMFSTFGVTAIHEVCDFMGMDILSDDGTESTLDLMAYIKDKVSYYKEFYGVPFNAEEIPGEQACVSLLKKDKIAISNRIPCDLYSNQYIPLIREADMVTRLDLSGRFMSMISGGGIVHLNSSHKIDSPGKMYELMRLAAKSGVPHAAVCYRYGKCADHMAEVVGDSNFCPVCGKPIVRARNRIIGYFSDESNWNPDRKKYDQPYRHFSEFKGDEE